MNVYRVFPYLPRAVQSEPGGALYVPAQGRGRIDNPDEYAVLYVADTAAGAIAEVFNVGDFRQKWTAPMLRPRADARLAVATYELHSEVRICDLDDASQLLELQLRPSDLVVRDYRVTRAWARQIYHMGRYAGVRWWSYHDARWASFGIWLDKESMRKRHLKCLQVEALTLDYPALAEAAAALSIEVVN